MIDENAFNGLNTLRYLDISNNDLNDVPNNAFKYLGLLESLYIGSNNLEKITANDFEHLGNLKKIIFNSCHHGRSLNIELDAFEHNTNLEMLNITKCPGLERLNTHLSLQDLPYLQSVNLHGCGLTSIPEHFLDWSTLRHLDLSSNPLHCDCRLLFLQEFPGLLEEGVICNTPTELAGRRLEEVDELECDEEEGDGGLLLGVTLSMTVLAVVMIVVGIVMWRKKPWGRSFRQNRRNRKRLSANYTGKDSIKVIQNSHVEPDGKRFINLPGLDRHSETDTDNIPSPIYAEVTETVPNYGIPIGTASFPDVKVSEL